MRRLLFLSFLIAAACDNTNEVAPTVLNFNRPIDIAFACYGDLRITNGSAADPSQPIIGQAEPVSACNIRSEAAGSGGITPVPAGQETLNQGQGSNESDVGTSSWYAFVLQSVPGTVGIASFATKPASSFTGVDDVTVLDADPLTPGKSGFTMGVQPIGLVADTIGCYMVTANEGSCDLSSLDVTSALNYQGNPQQALSDNLPVRINSLPVVNANGIPLRAKPAAIAAQPASGTIGVVCPQTPTGLAYVAYPSCHVVAGIDLSTGTVTSAIQLDANGLPTILTGDALNGLTCPDECSGGGQTTVAARPTSLDLSIDTNVVSGTGRRLLAIGSENSNVVSLIDLDFTYQPESISTVVLQNTTGSLGVNKVKVSPTIGMGGDSGMINDGSSPGPNMQFLYAITNDASVRVANIYNSVNTECDTQVDPRYLRFNRNIGFLSCMPVGAASTPPRRPGAIGPGIVLVNRLPAITTTTTTTSINTNPVTTLLGGTAAITPPMGIDIFTVPNVVGATAGPTTLVGYFGVITGANGQTYVLNIDDDAQDDFVGESDNSTNGDQNNVIGSQIPLDIANQIRDAVPDRGQLAEEIGSDGNEHPICDTDGPDPDADTGNEASARSYQSILTTVPTVPIQTFASDKLIELPSIQQVLCTGIDASAPGVPTSEIAFPAPTTVRETVYPDIMGMGADETWNLTYEGSLSIDTFNTAANGPPEREGMWTSDSTGMTITDQSLPFCEAGAQPWDIFQVRGCDPTLGNEDCPPDYDCFVHPDSQVQGIGQCMLATEADRLSDACKEFLVSQRRYTIATTTAGKITLLPRKHVLATTPVDGCTSDDQCHDLATFALQNQSSFNPIDDTTGSDSHSWTCMVDTARQPDLDGSGNVIKRCVEACGSDTDCDAGNVCQSGLCMEGIVPPQSCVNGPERYELDASEAFVVAGTLSGYHHNIIADTNGNCINNPAGSVFNIGRIPLTAPPCVASGTTPDLGIGSDGTVVSPNPCETTVDQWETENNYVTGTCTPGDPATQIVDRKADAIVFRGPAFTWTIVDPTYPGDTTCIGDRQGTHGRIPIVPTGTQISVRITGGFRPLFLDISPALPGKVARGPTQSIWVIDTGDYLSTSVDIASTEGKVFRVESQTIGVINVLE